MTLCHVWHYPKPLYGEAIIKTKVHHPVPYICVCHECHVSLPLIFWGFWVTLYDTLCRKAVAA